MSLTGALYNAMSGIRANSIAADIVGGNIANSLNENYARREVVLSENTATTSGGVSVSAINRATNPTAQNDWRRVNGQINGLTEVQTSIRRIVDAFGSPNTAGSIQNLSTEFEANLLSSASRPDLQGRLSEAAYSLSDLVDKINSVSKVIQQERLSADREIATAVSEVNILMSDIKEINADIIASARNSQGFASLMDQRDELLDNLSTYVNFNTYPRDRNAIAIYTYGGVPLLEIGAAEFEFSPTPAIGAHQNINLGTLSALQLDGSDVSASSFSGGKIADLFQLRDVIAIEAQAELDSFAYDLSTRLNDMAIDSTRTVGDIGLVTDAGTEPTLTNILGLSSRLEMNTTVNPKTGGNVELLRDGLMPVPPVDTGNSTILQALSASMTEQRSVTTGSFSGGLFSTSEFLSRISASFEIDLVRAEQLLVSHQSERDTFNALRLDGGVDSDIELQKLMLIEQSYGANARVIQVVDDLMETLLQAI